MKTREATVVLLFFFLVLTGLNAQQWDFNITGAGARADGFAGAFIGVADDATSVVWNPSGLATLERPEASVVTRIFSMSEEFEALDRDYKVSDSQSHFVLNFTTVRLK